MGQPVSATIEFEGLLYELTKATLYVGDVRFPRVNCEYTMKGLDRATR